MFFEKLKKKIAVMQYPTQLGNARVQVGAAPVNKYSLTSEVLSIQELH